MRKNRVLILVLVLLAIVLLSPLVTMLLWNWLMPQFFGVATVNLFEALGFMVLTSLLFYRGSGSRK